MKEILAKAKAGAFHAIERIRSMMKKAEDRAEKIADEVDAEETYIAETTKIRAKERWESIKSKFSEFATKLSPKEKLAIIFAIGIVLGFGAKTVASNFVTIGYRDYTAANERAYDLVELQKKVAEDGRGGVFSGGVETGDGSCQ